MTMLKALLLAGTVALASPFAALAQETVTVAGIETTRIVIAPPQTELARIIKAGLSSAYAAAEKGTRSYQQTQKLYFFYGARHFEPLWLSKATDGSIAFSPNAEKIIQVFKDSELEGFRPSDYLTADLDVAAAGTDPAKLAALETAFSSAAIRYAQDAFGGRISPLDVNKTWTIAPKRINEAEMLVKLADSSEPDKLLLALSPTQPEFLGLKAALAKFYDGAVMDTAITIPEGKLLKPGMQDERVTLLRQRLDVPEPDIPETSGELVTVDINYDEPLVVAVKAFQESLGLNGDGVIGPATIAALNGGSATTKEDIVANMERWRWEPNDYGDFQVTVNIPEFRLWIMNKDEVHYTTRVVVGTPKNQTAVFNDEIEHIVVNPYWNVPSSIATNEIKPHLIANPGYLASQNMEMLSGGKVINASAIDWTQTNINRFHIRQRPGAGNALGRVKFLFPNQHDIYLHDTPSKSLFSRSFRAYSHGCVRVENPMDFAGALLALEPELSAGTLEAAFGDKERWFNLKTKIPVHISYFTLRVDADGTIRSYGDVYGMNQRLKELLAE
ncbi:MAG TPA: L,D-transpeptidase family protein [Devosia sp.]|jgi:murein L,D-transpeptidase YcbB/YkuD|uniref:L,D-transpeptidase family protein n=1 Tax=Devosia sp. TaxID=1871048 RepID=UPI002DDCF6C3|nr:L,D-transpeptidase family protein [Devosia sp.]HEV2514383.1 L,D-transpeptidase family protein [Devosia sp.]